VIDHESGVLYGSYFGYPLNGTMSSYQYSLTEKILGLDKVVVSNRSSLNDDVEDRDDKTSYGMRTVNVNFTNI